MGNHTSYTTFGDNADLTEYISRTALLERIRNDLKLSDSDIDIKYELPRGTELTEDDSSLCIKNEESSKKSDFLSEQSIIDSPVSDAIEKISDNEEFECIDEIEIEKLCYDYETKLEIQKKKQILSLAQIKKNNLNILKWYLKYTTGDFYKVIEQFYNTIYIGHRVKDKQYIDGMIHGHFIKGNLIKGYIYYRTYEETRTCIDEKMFNHLTEGILFIEDLDINRVMSYRFYKDDESYIVLENKITTQFIDENFLIEPKYSDTADNEKFTLTKINFLIESKYSDAVDNEKFIFKKEQFLKFISGRTAFNVINEFNVNSTTHIECKTDISIMDITITSYIAKTKLIIDNTELSVRISDNTLAKISLKFKGFKRIVKSHCVYITNKYETIKFTIINPTIISKKFPFNNIFLHDIYDTDDLEYIIGMSPLDEITYVIHGNNLIFNLKINEKYYKMSYYLNYNFCGINLMMIENNIFIPINIISNTELYDSNTKLLIPCNNVIDENIIYEFYKEIIGDVIYKYALYKKKVRNIQ